MEGFSQEDQGERSREEEDQVIRSTKKVKTTEIQPDGSEGWRSIDLGQNTEELDEENRKGSYRDKLMGGRESDEDEDMGLDNEGESFQDESESDEDEGELDCPTIRVSKPDLDWMRRKWRNAVIIKLVGKRVGFKFLEKRIYQMWSIKSPLIISDLGNEFYMVKFSNENEFETALFGGPWTIADHYLYVCQWRPNFDPETATIDRLSVWVRLPNLPIEYYDRSFLARIGNRIGRTIRIDETTVDASRGKFARLYVDVDLSRPFRV